MTRAAKRNGVLVFLAWRGRRFAIVGDTGIHAREGDAFWQATVGASCLQIGRASCRKCRSRWSPYH